TGGHTGPAPYPPWPRSGDRGGRSRSGRSTAGWRRGPATARRSIRRSRPRCPGGSPPFGCRARTAGTAGARVLGSSQATALTAITTSGGKNPRPTLPGGLLQSLQALLEEALAPLAHDLAGQVHPGGDLLG